MAGPIDLRNDVDGRLGSAPREEDTLPPIHNRRLLAFAEAYDGVSRTDALSRSTASRLQTFATECRFNARTMT